MAINFPNNPAVNDTFTENSVTYTWDGISWNSKTLSTGIVIQEIIDSFIVAPGETINSGTFVDYINNSNLTFNKTKSIFNDAQTQFISAIALTNNIIIITYRDIGQSEEGYARLGIVSSDGTSISWLTESVFNNESTSYISLAVVGSNKIAVAYRTAGTPGRGFVKIGTINSVLSGTGMTWSGAYQFNGISQDTDFISMISIATDKILISYRDNSNSGFGTAIVGTIFGNAITFGNESVFNNFNNQGNKPMVLLEPNKVVITYSGSGSLKKGTARIGTINESNIIWSSEFIFNDASTDFISVTKLKNDKIAIAYLDNDNSSKGTAIVGIIDGNSISWGSEYIFKDTYSTEYSIISLEYDRIIICYRDWADSNKGFAVAGTIDNTSINWYSGAIFNSEGVNYISPIKLKRDRFAIAYGDVGIGGFNKGAVIIEDLPIYVINTNQKKFFGLAETGGSAGQTIEVYINE
jgi:hypothetical protein